MIAMLYVALSLILSALLLLFANGIAWHVRHSGALFVCSSLLVLIGLIEFPAVLLQGLMLGGAAIVWRASGRGSFFFLPLSCGATLVAYGLLAMFALPSEREYARLRVLYPYESMEGRLPMPKPIQSRTTLPPATVQRMSRLEGEIPDRGNGFQNYQLLTLHERSVNLFISSAGFGSFRMIRPSETSLARNFRIEPVPVQPGSRFSSIWSPGELERPPSSEEAPLSRMLDDSIVDFVNPRGFGYIKDRRHVAGFETHRFSQVPAPANRWTVRTLELVSLLLHDEPEVYVSDHLPRMERLHGQPTRPLDRFERYGLDALGQGEDMFVSKSDEGVRMLGAVRSTKQCIACHGGDRGDLLGAFSYALQSDR
jgi:hypothetical protein